MQLCTLHSSMMMLPCVRLPRKMNMLYQSWRWDHPNQRRMIYDLPQLRRLMMTEEEAKSKGNYKTANDAYIWMQSHEKRKEQGKFIIPGSGQSSGEFQDEQSTFYVPTPTKATNEDSKNANPVVPVQANDNENACSSPAVLRRKNTKKQGTKGFMSYRKYFNDSVFFLFEKTYSKID